MPEIVVITVEQEPAGKSGACRDMTPSPQPTGPTKTQSVIEEHPDLKMYKELEIVER
jgi:hypothetical protein